MIRFSKSDKNLDPPVDEDDAFAPEEDESEPSLEDFLGGFDNPQVQKLTDLLKSPELQEPLKEAAYNLSIYAINFMVDGYAVMRLTRHLNKRYPNIPALSFKESVSLARVLASIVRSAIYSMQLQPAKTYKEMFKRQD